MTGLGRAVLVAGLCLLAAGCQPGLREPVPLYGASGGQLDLRTWNFNNEGPVVPQGWAWDPGVLWSPGTGGRPETLASPVVFGPLDRGTGFGVAGLPWNGRPVTATASLTVRVRGDQSYGFQIGAFPGAYKVWVNGVLVWESGTVSADPGIFSAHGAGTTVTVQPQDGILAFVAEMVTSDPLVLHSEMNRRWILGPPGPMMAVQTDERSFRILQATVLGLGILVVLWISTLRRDRRNLVYFVVFLGVCIVKLLANVEQPAPLLDAWFPGVPLSWYLFLNHGFNLLPYPLLILFLVRQFPGDLKFRSFGVVAAVTILVEFWELLPFICLSSGSVAGYEAVMKTGWSFVLNLYVVLATLFVFERFYYLHSKRRPLSGALFFGGMAIGLIILVPVPLSYFLPVKFTYFFGWGLFFFLLTMIFALVRLQVRTTDRDLSALVTQVEKKEVLAHFIDPLWASRLGRSQVTDVKPGDRQAAETVLVQVRSSDNPDFWLPALGKVAVSRQALLVDWSDGTGTWALDSWSETALAFALEVQRALDGLTGVHYKVVLTRAQVEYRVLPSESRWWPTVTGLPRQRFAELNQVADFAEVPVVLDASVQDGLVIGGWRRHRHLSLSGREIELYEGEEETLAHLKDENLDTFEEALARARAGQFDQGILILVEMIRRNPFDKTARALLTDWRSTQNP